MHSLNDLFQMQSQLQTRWASPENWKGDKGAATRGNDGRKRSPAFPLKAGESRVLAEVTGSSGVVRRIWATISDRYPKFLRGIRLDIFWDGEKQPAVSAPLGDFFGIGLGRMVTFQNALFASPEGRSFNCYVPMPFRTGMKIVVTNESDADVRAFFYDVNYTLGDVQDDQTLWLHAHWRRENPTTIGRDYELLPRVTGRGRFLGVNAGIITNAGTYFRTWWGEGEVKVFLDGDTTHPTLCGTGTEDYIGTGWGQREFANLYQGCTVADSPKAQFCFYRWHVPDPVFFHQDIRVTIQQLGGWGDSLAQMRAAGVKLTHGNQPVDMDAKGSGIFDRTDDLSSCAFFYLNRPTNDLPALAPVASRIAGLP